MKHIEKLKLFNYRRFKSFAVEFEDGLNTIIGDNESGKSTIVEAISIVLSGSKTKIELIGLESLFNSKTIEQFIAEGKEYQKLPKLVVELYFNKQDNHKLNGNYNSEQRECDGLILEIEPDDEFSQEINDILNQPQLVFPFEFYVIRFKTFAGNSYSGYNKFVRHVLVNNTQINNDYAMKEYVKDMYNAFSSVVDKNINQNKYREHKANFKENQLSKLNQQMGENYQFTIRHTARSNLEADLALSEDNINLENKGTGMQCFIKTDFALSKHMKNLNVVLLEEPENH